MSLKNKLHALVDACEDDEVVESAIALFSSENDNWWATLPEAEKDKTLDAINELDIGKGVQHLHVMELAWKRIGK